MTQGSEYEINEQWAMGTDATRTPRRKRLDLDISLNPTLQHHHCESETALLKESGTVDTISNTDTGGSLSSLIHSSHAIY